MERPTCETCPYYNRGEIECHRNAPVPSNSTDNVPAYWPFTNHDDWCGEHPDFPIYIAELKLDRMAAKATAIR